MTPLEQWAARHGVSAAALAELATIYQPQSGDRSDAGSESGAQAALRVEAPKQGCSLWRNNSGATLDNDGRMIRYGLGNDSKRINDVWKSSDLIGISPVSWGGRTFGVFTAVEVKAPGWRGPRSAHERAQAAFLQTVESLGGVGMFATSLDEYRARVWRLRSEN